MKKRGLIVLLCSMSLLFCACGQSAGEKYTSSASMENSATDSGMAFDQEYDAEYSEDKAEITEENGSAEGETKPDYSQKLIRTYEYSFETTDFEQSIGYIEEQVAKYQGYIENSDTYGKNNRSSYMKIRIPEKKADAFLKDAGQIGEIIQKSESTEDITLNYYDTKSRLDSLKTQHARLLELLENAKSLEDIVALETHLSDIEYQIDNYGSQLKLYDNLVSYVTITIHLEEVSQIQAVEEDSFWVKISKGFTRNTEDVFDGVVSFVIFVITAIPYLIVLGVIVGIIYLIVHAIKKRKINKRIKKEKDRASLEQQDEIK